MKLNNILKAIFTWETWDYYSYFWALLTLTLGMPMYLVPAIGGLAIIGTIYNWTLFVGLVCLILAEAWEIEQRQTAVN